MTMITSQLYLQNKKSHTFAPEFKFILNIKPL